MPHDPGYSEVNYVALFAIWQKLRVQKSCGVQGSPVYCKLLPKGPAVFSNRLSFATPVSASPVLDLSRLGVTVRQANQNYHPSQPMFPPVGVRVPWIGASTGPPMG